MKTGIVYKIVCDDTGEEYIGSTFRTLRERMWEHRNKKNDCSSKQIIDRGNFHVENIFEGILEKCMLRDIEQDKILKSTKCINKIRATPKNKKSYKPKPKESEIPKIAALKFSEIFDKKFEMEELDKVLSSIFSEHFNTLAMCFGKRSYTLAELIERKLQYKVQFINNIIRAAGYLAKKNGESYEISPF